MPFHHISVLITFSFHWRTPLLCTFMMKTVWCRWKSLTSTIFYYSNCTNRHIFTLYIYKSIHIYTPTVLVYKTQSQIDTWNASVYYRKNPQLKNSCLACERQQYLQAQINRNTNLNSSLEDITQTYAEAQRKAGIRAQISLVKNINKDMRWLLTQCQEH